MNRLSNPSANVLATGLLAALAGCSLLSSSDSAPRAPATRAAPAGVSEAAAMPAATGSATPPPPSEPVPERVQLRYEAALLMMKTGRAVDAEPQLEQLAADYPQLAGPQVNLGLLYLGDSRLPEAESAFKAALKISPNNAVAGNELGITERRLGKFTEAETAYQQAIEADPNYAAAHLNLGVLYDLYLAQPQKALDQFERYLAIAGENKQVAGWVIELKKRVGTAPAKKEPA